MFSSMSMLSLLAFTLFAHPRLSVAALRVSECRILRSMQRTLRWRLDWLSQYFLTTYFTSFDSRLAQKWTWIVDFYHLAFSFFKSISVFNILSRLVFLMHLYVVHIWSQPDRVSWGNKCLFVQCCNHFILFSSSSKQFWMIVILLREFYANFYLTSTQTMECSDKKTTSLERPPSSSLEIFNSGSLRLLQVGILMFPTESQRANTSCIY